MNLHAIRTLRRSRFLQLSAAALGSFSIAGGRAKAAQFEFRCGSELGVDHPAVVRCTQMWDAVTKESGGRITCKMFPNNLLGAEEAMFGQLRVGALPFLIVNPGSLNAVVPSANVVNIGFVYKDPADALHAMDGPLGDYVCRETATKGMYLFKTMYDGGMYQIGANTHPINVPEDLRGFKVRVAQTRIAVDLFKELGASPTPLSFTEVYTGLQTKVIDGEAAPLVVIETSRFFEVQKYVSLTNHAWAAEWLLANGEAWKSLPADLQAIVERNQRKFALLERRDNAIAVDALISKLGRQGLGLNKVDQAPFRARLQNYFQTWAKEFGPTEWGFLETSLGRKLT